MHYRPTIYNVKLAHPYMQAKVRKQNVLLVTAETELRD